MFGVLLAAAFAASQAEVPKGTGVCPRPLAPGQAIQIAPPPASVKPVYRADIARKADRRFHKFDKNQDGKLVQGELPDNDRGRKALKHLDRNGDKALDKTEWSNAMLARFDKRDDNKDGTLVSSERGIRHSGTSSNAASNDDGDE